MEEGSSSFGNPGGRGGGRGGSKNRAFRHGGVDFFWNNPMLKSYPEKSFSLNFRHPFDVIIIKPNRSCYYVQKGHGFRETLVSVIVSTFLISMFVDQLLLVDEFSQLHLCQKTTMLEVLLSIVKIMKALLYYKHSFGTIVNFLYE